jgi:uncharacterized NAD-dependent epimerase/dehydratase family protein
MLGRGRRLAVLAEGRFTALDAKTAVGILRYRPDQVAAVIDSTRAGRTAADCVGIGGAVPVVADLEAAAECGADTLLIGIAPQGGELPLPWRKVVGLALARGWDVLAGLHAFLSDDPEFRALAEANGARIVDARRPPRSRPLAAGRAAQLEALVVLTVGSDCNVGKMTAALELRAALASRGVRAAFVATGQTGIFVADRGVAIDAVPADFVAGTVEQLVIEAAEQADVVIVEGQGALHHPAYSGVTLSLLHGAAPAALVLCHSLERERLRVSDAAADDREIAPLEELRRDYERAASWVAPARTIGLALNTLGVDEPRARAACVEAGRALDLPATDPVRFGCDALAVAVARASSERRGRRRLEAGAPGVRSRGGSTTAGPGGSHANHA